MIDRPRASVKMGPKPAEAPAAPPAAEAPAPPQPKQPAPRKPAQNPRQSEYDRLLELVEQLRRQFPNKSEAQILELARKIIAKEQEDADMWANVKSEYGVTEQPARRAPPSSKPQERFIPSPSNRGSEVKVPASAPAMQYEPAAAGDVKPYVSGGVPGVWVPNPEYGKRHGLIWDGKGWQDGSMQNQAMDAQKAEQEFLAEKRRMELDRLRMEMELERLQKEREMAELRKDPALSGLISGTVQQGAVRPLAGRGLMY